MCSRKPSAAGAAASWRAAGAVTGLSCPPGSTARARHSARVWSSSGSWPTSPSRAGKPPAPRARPAPGSWARRSRRSATASRLSPASALSAALCTRASTWGPTRSCRGADRNLPSRFMARTPQSDLRGVVAGARALLVAGLPIDALQQLMSLGKNVQARVLPDHDRDRARSRHVPMPVDLIACFARLAGNPHQAPHTPQAPRGLPPTLLPPALQSFQPPGLAF